MVVPCVVYWLSASDAFTVKVNDPAALGTPVILPSLPSVRPPGKAPPSSDHVYGDTPPLAPRVVVYTMPTSPPAIGMPVIDAGVEACVGLGTGVGDGLGVGGTMVLLARGVADTHAKPQSKTTVNAAASRHNELMPGPALGGPVDREDLLVGDRVLRRDARAMVDQVDGHPA